MNLDSQKDFDRFYIWCTQNLKEWAKSRDPWPKDWLQQERTRLKELSKYTIALRNRDLKRTKT